MSEQETEKPWQLFEDGQAFNGLVLVAERRDQPERGWFFRYGADALRLCDRLNALESSLTHERNRAEAAEREREKLTVRLAYINVWLQGLDAYSVRTSEEHPEDAEYLDKAMSDLWQVLDDEGSDRKWLDKAHEKDAEIARLTAQAARGAEALREALPLLEYNMPPAPNHICGPEAGCDGLCVDYAHAVSVLTKVRHALTPDASKEVQA